MKGKEPMPKIEQFEKTIYEDKGIGVYYIPNYTKPEEPCHPRAIIPRLLNEGKLTSFLEVVTDTRGAGGQDNSHLTTTALIAGLIALDCADGWTWEQGVSKQGAREFVHTWAAHGEWCIDASTAVPVMDEGIIPIMIAYAPVYLWFFDIRRMGSSDVTEFLEWYRRESIAFKRLERVLGKWLERKDIKG